MDGERLAKHRLGLRILRPGDERRAELVESVGDFGVLTSQLPAKNVQRLSLARLRRGELAAILVQVGKRQDPLRDGEIRLAVEPLAQRQRLLEERLGALLQASSHRSCR